MKDFCPTTILKQSYDQCVYCQRTYPPFGSNTDRGLFRTTDHMIPVSRGGKRGFINQIYACYSCNTFKANLTPREFARLAASRSRRRPAKNGMFPVEYYQSISKNANALADRIAPFENTLYRKGIRPEKQRDVIVDQQKIIAELLKLENIHAQLIDEQEFVDQFRRRYPAAFAMLTDVAANFPSWIYNNLLSLAIKKDHFAKYEAHAKPPVFDDE